MGFLADGLHHRPGSPRRVLGTDAFQETESPASTLPITKHNYLVHACEDIYPNLREAFHPRPIGAARAGARRHHQDAQQATFEFRPEDGPVPRFRPHRAAVAGGGPRSGGRR